jgi:hypothetical protein
VIDVGSRTARVGSLAIALCLLALVGAPSVAACSPPFGQPTIAALGPNQLVLLGVTGDKVPTGREFRVERAWNADANTSPIVIAFKEGEPVGDCSYPMSTGRRLVIAPDRQPDGRLSADLVTLQADPNSDDGRRYLAEAQRLFGDGTVPVNASPAGGTGGAGGAVGLVALAAVGLLLIAGIALVWRRA